LKADPRLRFAGQITGVEGYVESAAIGLLAGRFSAAKAQGWHFSLPPPTTALGALLGHITGGHLSSGEGAGRTFQPMNVNFGLFPPLLEPLKRQQGGSKTLARKQAMASRALADLDRWLKGVPAVAAE
jgi:methylenetetrahydrofolate--tRNA-(uracil-5-)-methyltransferase